MKFPHMVYSDEIVRQTQVRFGGYKHSLYANDGDIYDMRNITANIFPLITPRTKRSIVKPDTKIVLYKGNVYSFSGENRLRLDKNLSGMIKNGDKIKIEGGANEGEYIADVYRGANDEIEFATGTFTKVTQNSDPIAQDAEITVTRLARSGEITTDVTVNTTVKSDSQTGESVTYAFLKNDSHPDAYTKTTVKITSEKRYKKRTTVVTNTFIYNEEPEVYEGCTLQEQYIASDGTRYDSVDVARSPSGTLSVSSFVLNNKLILTGDCPEDYKEPLIITFAGYKSSGEIRFRAKGTRANPKQSYPNLTLSVYKYVSTDTQTEVTTDPTVYRESQTRTVTTDDSGEIVVTTTVEYIPDGYDVTTETTVETADFIDENLEISAIGSGDKFYYVDSEGRFYYDNEYIGKLTPGKKEFAETGAFLFILPDKAYFNTKSKTLTEFAKRSITQRKLTDGWLIDNVTSDSIVFGRSNLAILTYFKTGETVNMEFSYNDGRVQKATGTIKEIKTNSIVFTANVLSSIDVYVQYLIKLTIYNSIPDLSHICAANNRVWGCDDKTVYCSAFGAPGNWNYFETGAAGVADNSWSIQPFDSSGDFTGCVTLGDKPVFFKENKVYTVYGSNPADFTLQAYDVPGAASGSAKSIVIIKDEAFYLSPEGVIRFSGGMSDNISGDFFEQLENGVAGTDGTRYYLSAQTVGGYKIFVFNTQNGKWCIEDEKEVSNYTMYKRRLFMLSGNEINCVNPGELPYPVINSGAEDDKESFIEFGDYYCDSPDKKAVSKLYLRFTIEQGGTVEIDINYDSEKNENGRVWNVIKTLSPGSKKSYVLPVIPRRADHFRIRIKGRGFVLYSLSHEYYSGTAL